jgi:hypothetical protein
MTPNEGKACDAALQSIERRENAHRNNLKWPEKDGIGEPVELVCEVGAQTYAFEHTAIEPFEGHIQLNNQAGMHFHPIREAVSPLVPTDEVWELTVPVNVFRALRMKDIRKMQGMLISWVKQTAPTLPKRPFAEVRGLTKITPPGLSFAVYLARYQAAVLGYNMLVIKHLASDDRGAAREERIRIACNKKFGKLAAWKADGARTVLVLENLDIQITNVAHVAETFLSIIKGRSDAPDEVYQLDTYTTGGWFLWPLLIGGKTYFDLGQEVHPLAWEIDP